MFNILCQANLIDLKFLEYLSILNRPEHNPMITKGVYDAQTYLQYYADPLSQVQT